MKLDKRLRWFFERKLIMLFLWEERFLNPLIPDEMSQLKTSGLLEDEDTLKVLEEIFPDFTTQLPTGMYFPVPISKAVKQGNNFTIELAIGFHYDFIKIDQKQKWRLRDKFISGKVLALFESNLFFEKDSKLYYVEYWSNNRWDKCYLDCEITPMLALGIKIAQEEFLIQLNNQKTDSLDPHSFRIDKKERCFVISQNYGEVMLADTPRFLLLNHLNESGSYFVFGKKHFPLAYHE